MKKSEINKFLSIILTAVMLVTLVPVVPVIVGREEQSGNVAYAGKIAEWKQDNYLNFTAENAKMNIKLYSGYKVNSQLPSIEYKIDSGDWSDWNIGSSSYSVDLNVGSTIYFRAKVDEQHIGKEHYTGNSYHTYFTIKPSVQGTNGTVKAAGSVMSLLSQTCNPNIQLNDYEFYALFADTNGSRISYLSSIPELPATNLAEACYCAMFNNIPTLTDLSGCVLPATSMAAKCYYWMFSDCTGITKAPAIMATDLAASCFYHMFSGCTSLTDAPELPAETMAESCYEGMFNGCSALKTAPELPATALAKKCYYQMFNGCTSLETAPELPATTLAEGCYGSMFYGCKALETAPELPAPALVKDCYQTMFDACSSLNEVKVKFTEWPDGTTTSWLWQVASTGKFYCPAELDQTKITANVPVGWTVYDIGTVENYLSLTAEGTDFNLKFVSNYDPLPSVQYKIGSGAWTSWNDWSGSTGVELQKDSTIYFRTTVPEQHLGNYNEQEQTIYSSQFKIEPESGSGSVKASGSIMSLLSNTCDSDIQLNTYEFYQLFKNCSLSSVPELPAQKLGTACYGEMFTRNRGLTNLSEFVLPATTMAAVCYYSMFSDCTNLTKAPQINATSLASQCFSGMFSDCSKLTEAPELPVTTLADNCYMHMFSDCESLASAPELPAEVLAVGCYQGMFSGCQSLTEIKVKFTEWGSDAECTKWVEQVADHGTFYCPSALDTTKIGENAVPENWTIKYIDADAEASTGYFITFTPSDAIVNGFKSAPSKVVVKKSDGEGEILEGVTATDSIISFPYTADLYEISFIVDGKIYTMHANCKTKDIDYTLDTRYIEDAIGDIKTVSSVAVSEGSVPMMVTSGLTAGIVAPKSSIDSFKADAPADNYEPATLADQVAVDEAAMNFRRVYNTYLTSLNAPLLTVSDGAIAKIDYSENQNVGNISISYAEGIYASKANAVSTEEFGNSLTPEANKVYTFFTQADICGNTKCSVVYYGAAADLLVWANGQLPEGKKLSDLDKEEDVIAAYFNVTKPEPSGSGTSGETPVDYLEKGIDDLVTFTIDNTNGLISWEAKAPSIVIERVAYARGDVKEDQNAKYMPLCEGDTDFYTLAKEAYTIKMLLRSGDEIKTFYKVVSADEVTAVNTPAVEVYSGAIAAYGRGCNPASIAYVEGSFDTLAEAKAAELAEENPVKVYYIKEGAKLDSTPFKGDFTFFFGETPLKVHFN